MSQQWRVKEDEHLVERVTGPHSLDLTRYGGSS